MEQSLAKTTITFNHQIIPDVIGITNHIKQKKSYEKPRQHIKKQRCYFVDKDASSQSYGFSSSHVWM